MSQCPFSFLSRRSFMKSLGGGVGLLAASTGVGAMTTKVAEAATTAANPHGGTAKSSALPFWGDYQAGIITPQQAHTYFAAFDLTTKKREEVIQLLKDWTDAADKLTQGKAIVLKVKKPAQATPDNEENYSNQSTADSGEAKGLPPARLTLTFGFGSGLFKTKEGVDRYNLAKHRPEALVDMPAFHGDELVEAKGGGDLSIQACCDDPQVAFHAIRQLARLAEDVAQIRWAQTGFLSGAPGEGTPRNLMGFKDGTQQPKASEYPQFVWVGKEGPEWLRNGTYLVTRRIRIALEHWDRTETEFQEQVIGRRKNDGAPLGQKTEREVLNLTATGKDGNPVIPENSHVRLASAAANGGSQMLRRGYSYNDGVNFTAERWPPWKQGMEYDAGLFFVSYQTDPRTAFIKVFQNIAKIDALNQFVTHVSSGLYVCPPGAKKGEYIGQKLFELA